MRYKARGTENRLFPLLNPLMTIFMAYSEYHVLLDTVCKVPIQYTEYKKN